MNNGQKRIIRSITWLIFIIYIIALVYFLFFSERYGRTVCYEYKYNLVPFSEIKRYFLHYDIIGFEGFFVNIIGNVVAFIPFGLCIPILHSNYRHLWTVVFDGFIFTVCIETIQLMYRVGSLDVDDILLNTIGAAMGYALYKIIMIMYKSFGSKRKR